MTAQPPPPTGPSGHAKHGPSGLKNKAICPGFTGRQGTSPAAEMGNRIHAALEVDDLNLLTDAWEISLAEKCLEARENIMRSLKFVADEDHRELLLDIDLGDGLTTFGTSDVVMISGDRCVQIDWKTGRMAVDDATTNFQAQAYSVGCFQKFPHIQQVDFFFVLPARDEISHATYYREDVEGLKMRIARVIQRAEEAEELLARGDGSLCRPNLSVCGWCANTHRCPALTDQALNLAGNYDDSISIPEIVRGSLIEDPEEIAKLLPLVPILKSWCEGISKRAREIVFEEGYDIPGYEFKERAGSKVITSARAAWEAVQGTMSLEEFLDLVKDLPFNSIADKIYAAAPKGKKTKAKNSFEDLLRDSDAIADKPSQVYLSQKRK